MGTVRFSCNSAEQVEPWVYRGEGNAHLALALPTLKRILRIKKDDQAKSRSMLQWLWYKLFTWNTQENCIRDVLFYKNVMMPFFGYFVDDVLLVALSADEIYQLQMRLEEYRPEKRKHKSLKVDNAALFTDYAFLNRDIYDDDGPSYAIELKPKQGYATGKGCQYCEKQIYKLKTGQIKEISEYCPLDLFSGNETRMLKAIESLCDNPQNNMQLFKNGEKKYCDNSAPNDLLYFLEEVFNIPCEKRLKKEFYNFIRLALIAEFSNNETHECPFESSGTADLPKNCVLSKILALQKCDYVRSSKYLKTEGREYEYADRYLEGVVCDKHHCPKCVMFEYLKEKETIVQEGKANEEAVILSREAFNDLSEKQRLPFLVSHYIAKIVKDCSLMITFKKINRIECVSKDNVIKTECGSFAFDVKVFDLYPKPQKID